MIAKELHRIIDAYLVNMHRDDFESDFPHAVSNAILAVAHNCPIILTTREKDFLESLGYTVVKAGGNRYTISADAE